MLPILFVFVSLFDNDFMNLAGVSSLLAYSELMRFCFYHPGNYIKMQTLQGTAKSYINEIKKEYLLLENARKEKFTIKEAEGPQG